MKLILRGAVPDEYASRVESFLSRAFPVLSSLALTMMSYTRICSIPSGIYLSSTLRWLDLTRTSLPWTKPVLTDREVLSLTDSRLSTLAPPFGPLRLPR